MRHGSTFGGNDMAAAAGLATLGVIEREGLVARAAQLGELLLELTRPLVDRYEIVRDVRGLGLMWAIELGAPERLRRRAVWNLVERAQTGLAAQLLVVPLFQRHRIFCQVAGHRMNVVKALPALVVSEEEIRRFAAALEDVVARADRMGRRRWAAGLGSGARRRSRAAAVRALVTGAAGFIGSHVVAALAAAGAEVRAFDRRDAGGAPGRRRVRAGRPARPRRAAPRAVRLRRRLPPRRALQLRARATPRRWSASTSRARAPCSRRRARGASSTPPRARPAGRSPAAPRPRPTRPPHGSCACPTSARSSPASGSRWRPRPRGADVVIVNPTTPVGPGDRRPTPTGKMVADVARGRARAYLARSALNIVAVEDVARGHLLAYEHGRAGRRYLLGGENLAMREVFAAICDGGRRGAAARRGAVERGLRRGVDRRAGSSAIRGCSCSTRCAWRAGRCASTTRWARARAGLQLRAAPPAALARARIVRRCARPRGGNAETLGQPLRACAPAASVCDRRRRKSQIASRPRVGSVGRPAARAVELLACARLAARGRAGSGGQDEATRPIRRPA